MTSSLKNDLLLRALRRQPTERTPVWMMRQAGRYLPEYMKIRREAGNFMALCTNPELACEVTLQPLRRYDMDAAILFSDILIVLEALGAGVRFAPGGPVIDRPVTSGEDLARLRSARTSATSRASRSRGGIGSRSAQETPRSRWRS